jgi:hypothetical protein
MLTMAAGSSYAAGLPATCFLVQPGNTAASLARHFTGNASNRHQPWFQIVNPATATAVPKSDYARIQPGWHVCVATTMLRAGPPAPGYQQLRAGPPMPLLAGVAQPRSPIDFGVVWLAAPFAVVSGLVLGWLVSRRYVGDRRMRLDVMRGFSARFVSEFERPLFRRSAADAPVKWRLRFAPAHRRLEILLAPAGGRTYPNLGDHRRNVEYDVDRVLRLLGDEPFIHGPLHAEGPWVVIPFHFEASV